MLEKLSIKMFMGVFVSRVFIYVAMLDMYLKKGQTQSSSYFYHNNSFVLNF